MISLKNYIIINYIIYLAQKGSLLSHDFKKIHKTEKKIRKVILLLSLKP